MVWKCAFSLTHQLRKNIFCSSNIIQILTLRTWLIRNPAKVQMEKHNKCTIVFHWIYQYFYNYLQIPIFIITGKYILKPNYNLLHFNVHHKITPFLSQFSLPIWFSFVLFISTKRTVSTSYESPNYNYTHTAFCRRKRTDFLNL